MRKCDLGLKGSIVTFLALFVAWVGIFVLINAFNLAVEHQVVTTALFWGMLIVPAFCVGLVTHSWLTIIIAPFAYLMSAIVSYAMSAFSGIPGDLGVPGYVIVQLTICAAMALAFLTGRGLGRLFPVCQQEGRH